MVFQRTALAAMFLGLSLLAPGAATAAPAAKAGTQAVVRPTEAEARKFLSVYLPRDVQRSSELATLRTTFIPTMEKDPGLKGMLAMYPDLGPALLKAMEGQIDLYVDEFNERYPPRAVPVLRSALSQSELREIKAFYASPLGQRVIRLSAENVDASEVAELGLKGEAVDLDVANRQALSAGMATLSALSAEDRKAVFAFSLSPVGRKFMAVRDRLMAIQAELISKPGPRFEAATEKAMIDAMQRVIGVEIKDGN
jgi:hypothetical protein